MNKMPTLAAMTCRGLLLLVAWMGGSVVLAQSPANRRGTPARSQPPARLTSAQQKQLLDSAKTQYREGRKIFQQRRFAASIPVFARGLTAIERLEAAAPTGKKKSYRRYKLGFYATMAVAYQWQKKLVKARAYYARCAVSSAPKRIQKVCKKYLPEVERQLAYISIESKPADAILRLRKGQQSGWTSHRLPFGGWRMPGTLHVQLTKKGYASLQRLLKLRPGVRLKILYTLEKPSCPTPAKPAPTLPPGDQLQLSTTVAAAASMPPMTALPQPFQGGTMPPWQIALVAGGAVIGAAALVGGVAAIAYGATNRRYVIQKNP